jgi:L,D-transpeptidase catalytic domain
MNKIALLILMAFGPIFGLRIQAQTHSASPIVSTAIYVNLSLQTRTMVENRADGTQTIRSTCRISSGRLGMETPLSPPEGWVVGAKHVKYWSNKFHCWMPYAVNIGAKNARGEDDGDYLHVGRIPLAGYATSHGCVRQEEYDAIELFQWVQPGKTRVFITGSVKDYLENHFPGYKLLEFNTDGSIKGFKRNPDGSLTEDFLKYASQGKIDTYLKDRNGKVVPMEQRVLAFEFFDRPWEQGIPKAEYEIAQVERIKKLLGDLYQPNK